MGMSGKWDVEDVLGKVSRCEDDKADYRKMADFWEKMWRMEVPSFKMTDAEARDQGIEQIALATPYNTVNLLCRLIGNEPKIQVPARDMSDLEVNISEKKERWLAAAWALCAQQQRTDIIGNAKWQSAVRAYHAFEVKWIESKLPKHLKGKRFPIMIRNLDPLAVGIKEGPLYTEFAYHKYSADLTDVFQRYPEYKKRNKERFDTRRRGQETVEAVDFWYVDEGSGKIWNCVVIDEEYVVKPRETQYTLIPLVVGAADVSFSKDKAWHSLSILHPIRDTWQAMSRLMSMKMTQARWFSDPYITFQNEMGEEIPDIVAKPGKSTQLPWGTKVDTITFQPNSMVTDQTFEMLSTDSQQATFPGVMHGQAPGSLQAGYGVSILANAAQGRIASAQYNLERSMEQCNAIMFSLVESNAVKIGADGGVAGGDGIGVRVWGKADGKRGFFYETLFAEEIDGYYENRVRLTPNVPQNDIQDQTLGMRLVEMGIASKQWYRDNLIQAPISPDEDKQVLVEQMMEDPTIKPKMMVAALQKRFPDTWQEIVRGTEYDEEFKAQQQQMAQQQAMQQQPPPQMPPDMGQMGGGMPPQGPPMGQMPPPMPQMAPPGEMGGPSPLQFPSMNMDEGSIPPQIGAQFVKPPDVDPVVWAIMTGQPLPPATELPLG